MPEPAIRFQSLTKHYGPIRALDGMELEVRPGEVFGFLGPNGAGKTTAIRVLMDLIRPTAGTVTVLGLDAQRDAVELHRRVGYLPADAGLYEGMTGHAYLDYLTALRGGRVDAAYRAELVERLQLDVQRRIGGLSRGNRQKMGLVQALMGRPELVVLDEPTAGLDPLMQEVVEELLRGVADAGRTVFFSSHVLAEVEQVCDRVAMLRAGRIVDVFDLAEQRRLAPRRVSVEFASPPDDAAFAALPGVRVERADGLARTFEVRDGIDALVKCLARFEVTALDSREPTLEELFLSRYGDVVESADAESPDVS